MSPGIPADLGLPRFRPRQREKRAPCGEGCPNHADVRGWVGVVAQRRRLGLSREEAYQRAWRMIVDRNPLPASIGRVCPHPCESQCNRADLDAGIRVHHLERFLGDWALDRALPLPRRAMAGTAGSVGVIGAGPAGLSAAYQLIRRGHAVTLYDRHPEPGGMLRYGIPDYRLPPRILNGEIDRILSLGIELRVETAVGRDVDLNELRQLHDALFLGIGAQRARRLDLPGARPDVVRTGIDYLHDVNGGAPAWCGDSVVVIGGGNTAVDAARTARRSGAEVLLAYRRGRTEMPAFEDEVEAMTAEGVRLETLVAPVRIETAGDGIPTLVLQRMRLGDLDDSGRRRPVPLPGVELRVPCDALITAVAQEVGWDRLDDLRPPSGWLAPGEDGWVADSAVWAGGDVVGAGFASRAVAEGRRAAEAIHASLAGGPRPAANDAPLATLGVVKLDAYETRPPSPLGVLLGDPDRAAELPDAVDAEAARCLSCGLCFGCERCWMYCSSGGFRPAEHPGHGRYFILDTADCESCGKCADICPCGFLEIVDESASAQIDRRAASGANAPAGAAASAAEASIR